MPYSLEYISGVGAGWFVVEGLDFPSALAKAKDALIGLDCLRALLLFSPDPKPAFGKGSVHAAFTQDEGWHIQNERPEQGHRFISSQAPTRSRLRPDAILAVAATTTANFHDARRVAGRAATKLNVGTIS